MPSCAVRNCKNNSWNTKKQKISYLSFPKEKKMIEKWKIVCKEDVNSKFARICSKHFHPSQFEDKSWLRDFVGKSGNVRVKLKRDAVPLITDVKDNKISTDNDLEVDVAQSVAHCSFNPNIDCTASTSISSCATQVALNTAVIPNIDISQKMQKLQHRNATLLLETKALHLKTETHKCQQALKDKLYKKQLMQRMQDKLTPFFTPEQIELFLNLTQKIRWTKEDIEAAISLKSISSKAYRYLRKTKQIPAMSTLRKWIADFNTDKGILTDVSAMTKEKSQNMTEMERASVLYSDEISSFDEIYLSNQVQIEESKEKVYVYVVFKN